jgi:tRNA(Ile)-lysidine synthase
VVLLDALARQARDRFPLAVLHVHHGLSPSADHWLEFCADICKRIDIPFSVVRVAVERGSRDGLESAARRVRHAAFASADADWVILAHHRGDQAETLLFNLLRGTGLAGAAAMRERTGRLLRPLLGIERAEIEVYARSRQLAWIEDESNVDTRHARNYLRRRVLPEIVHRFPAANRTLAAAAARFAEAGELIDDLARLDLGTIEDFPADIQVLRRLSEPRARNALRYLLSRRGVMIPSETRLRETLRQLLEAAPDRHPAVVLGIHRICRRHGLIYLESVEL